MFFTYPFSMKDSLPDMHTIVVYLPDMSFSWEIFLCTLTPYSSICGGSDMSQGGSLEFSANAVPINRTGHWGKDPIKHLTKPFGKIKGKSLDKIKSVLPRYYIQPYQVHQDSAWYTSFQLGTFKSNECDYHIK